MVSIFKLKAENGKVNVESTRAESSRGKSLLEQESRERIEK